MDSNVFQFIPRYFFPMDSLTSPFDRTFVESKKEEGNQYFKKNQFGKALESYSQSLGGWKREPRGEEVDDGVDITDATAVVVVAVGNGCPVDILGLGLNTVDFVA